MNKQELSKLLDEKLKGVATKKDLERITTDVSAIEARVAQIEDRMATRLDWLGVRHELGKLEKRLTAVEGKLGKTATKDDLTAMEERLEEHIHQEITRLYQHLREELVPPIKERIQRLEEKVAAFTS